MNKTIIRNTAQTLTWTKSGDYSSDTIKFTVKADRTLTSSRMVDKTASVSYADGVSTFTVALVPSDSASLSSDSYYYDLRVETSSTDRELLHNGIAYVDKSVRNDTDGSTVSSASTVTTLTGADFDADDTLVSDGTDIIGKSVSEMKTLLGVGYNIFIQQVTLYSDPAVINTNTPYSSFDGITALGSENWTRSSAGVYTNTFGKSLSSSKTVCNSGIVYSDWFGTATGLWWLSASGTTVTLNTFNLSGVAADVASGSSTIVLEIKEFI